MRVLLVSTYELGHQPLHLAVPAAALLAAGHEVTCVDISVEVLPQPAVDWAERVALAVPMHTAMRLALRVADVIRSRRPEVPLCFYGLYAPAGGVARKSQTHDALIAGEYLDGLVSWAGGGEAGAPIQLARAASQVELVPARHLLPSLDRYARLAIDGEERLSAAIESTRGCSHHCRHCPVPVVYRGRVRATREDALLSDVEQLVAAGARHLTFADPDFLNSPARSRRVVAAVHERHPELTFDCTTKVEHILRHRDVWEGFAAAGCAFVVSAFESVNDEVLRLLAKGHTSADASEAIGLLRSYGIEVRPSWLPFTPWTSTADLVALVDFVVSHDLVPNVDPVQYTMRLLVPHGSLLAGSKPMARHLGRFDPDRLGWTWAHPDPAIDALQADLAAMVEEQLGSDPWEVFGEVDALIRAAAPRRSPTPSIGSVSRGPLGQRPRLTEPWFCCSEPTEVQLSPLG